MFKKVNIIRLIKTLIKLSAVALISPATVAVDGSLYPKNPITRFIVSIAALILIEGCLLLGWEMLDRHGKHATMAQRWLYAGLAWVAYLSLFGIALYHNEGIAGLTFRLTLGVMLVYANLEAGLLASVKLQKQAERDVSRDWQVKRYARRLARKSAMADLDLDTRMSQLDRGMREKVYTLQVKQKAEQLVESVKLTHGLDSQKSVEMTKSDTFLDRANHKRRLSKREALDKTLQILTVNSDTSPTEIATAIGRSRQTVYSYLIELETEGKISRNGTGLCVSEP